MPQPPASEFTLRSYPGPWKGELVLVCQKCQKKLKHSGGKNKLAKMKKTLRKRAQRRNSPLQIAAVDVSCLKMCPKGGVTVATGAGLAQGQCSIVRSVSDVDALIEQCAAEIQDRQEMTASKNSTEVSTIQLRRVSPGPFLASQIDRK